jgi:hypothetical protein
MISINKQYNRLCKRLLYAYITTNNTLTYYSFQNKTRISIFCRKKTGICCFKEAIKLHRIAYISDFVKHEPNLDPQTLLIEVTTAISCFTF